MAHLRRPVPMIFCAAKPPGSLDFTYFFSSIVSSSATSAGAATVAVTEREARRADWAGNENNEFVQEKESVFGPWETWEEKERDEREEARFETDKAIVAGGSSHKEEDNGMRLGSVSLSLSLYRLMISPIDVLNDLYGLYKRITNGLVAFL